MRRVAICCIEHALLLVSSVDVALDEDAQTTLNTFTTYRDKLKEYLTAQNALKTPLSNGVMSRSGSLSSSFSQLPLIGEKPTDKNGNYISHYCCCTFMHHHVES